MSKLLIKTHEFDPKVLCKRQDDLYHYLFSLFRGRSFSGVEGSKTVIPRELPQF